MYCNTSIEVSDLVRYFRLTVHLKFGRYFVSFQIVISAETIEKKTFLLNLHASFACLFVSNFRTITAILVNSARSSLVQCVHFMNDSIADNHV